MRAVESTPFAKGAKTSSPRPLRKSSYDSSGTGLISSHGACDLREMASHNHHRAIVRRSVGSSVASAEDEIARPTEPPFAAATKTSLVVNFGLLVVKIYISYVSGSLAFLASAVDSLLDLVSQSIIYYALQGNENVDENKYPLGRARLEPVGIVVVASLMGMASLQVVLESLYTLIDGYQDPAHITLPDVSYTSIMVLVVSIVLKFFLYLMCRQVRLLVAEKTAN